MRRLALGPGLAPAALLEALAVPSPLSLDLDAAPPLPRLDLLLVCARFSGPLFTRFSGRLASPLVEVACLSLESAWTAGSSLDLAGCLFGPLLARAGEARLRRLLSRGEPVDPASLLAPARPLGGRSPAALSLLGPLLIARPRSARAALAAERAAFGLVMASGDRREGVRAFRERRPPVFDW